MGLAREVCQHPRLIEFQDAKFYNRDFNRLDFKFLTAYDMNRNILQEYAHIAKTGYHNFWVRPNSEIITTGTMIEELVAECKKHNEILLDVYIDDAFKPNPTLKRKCIFGYKMSMSDATKKTWSRGKKGWIEQLYNLEAVDDIHSFHSLSQVIPEI